MNLCGQCNVRDLDTLVAIVSVIRPGAANEQKKAAFARRCEGMEPIRYTHPSLESALRSTFGLVVYEEHILQICEGFAGSLRDFWRRVVPSREEMEAMLRVGAFDEFGRTRTARFWEVQQLAHARGNTGSPGQGWLEPPRSSVRLPETALQEPTPLQRLEWENELLGFPASAHPLAFHGGIAWDTYCPVSRLKEFVGEEVVTCGLVIEQRTHHQVTGEPMKFLTLADWTGMVETELFAPTYRHYGPGRCGIRCWNSEPRSSLLRTGVGSRCGC